MIAATVDWLILAVPALAVGFLFFDALTALGQNGRVIGATLSLVYFGLFNSGVDGGQTWGKKLLGIRVVGASGSPISLPRSLARWLVLALPFYLNGLDFSPFVQGYSEEVTAAAGAFALMLVFGFGAALTYLYVFNRGTRQSLHDLFVESFVVRVAPEAAVASRVWPAHVWIALALIASSLLVPAFLGSVTSLIATDETFASLNGIVADLEKNPEILRATASTQTVTSWSSDEKAATTSFLLVTVYARKRFDDATPLIRQTAKAVLQREPKLLGADQLKVTAIAEFDLGIATGSISHSQSGTAEEWRKALEGGTLLVRSQKNDTVSAFIGRGRDWLNFVLPHR